jgi:hypothetical protein
MKEAVSTSEKSVNFYQTTWRNIPEESHLHTHRRENLKSHTTYLLVDYTTSPMLQIAETQITFCFKSGKATRVAMSLRSRGHWMLDTVTFFSNSSMKRVPKAQSKKFFHMSFHKLRITFHLNLAQWKYFIACKQNPVFNYSQQTPLTLPTRP